MPFPNQVNVQPSPAVEGDFASENPRFSVNAGPGGLIAGAGGVTIGKFAWITYATEDPDNAPATVNSFGVGPVGGFVHRQMQGLITTFLTEAGMTIQPGFFMALMAGGDFWVINRGTTQALPGMFAYADFATGNVRFGAAASALTATSTASSVAASTFTATGSITGNVLTLTNVSAGVVVNGATISGGAIAAGTQIVSQLSGTPGGAGTYSLNIPEQTIAAGQAIAGTYGTLTVGGTIGGTGSFGPGGLLSGTGVAAGTAITQNLTGSGGAGTYAVNNNTVVASTAISATINVQTKWVAMSAGLPNELVKISSQPLG